MPTTFKNVQKTGYVALYVGMGIFQAIAYTGLGSQVNYGVE